MATQSRAVLDALTNELIYVEVTADEIAQLAKDNEAAAAVKALKETEKIALLEKLGITADEAKVLLS